MPPDPTSAARTRVYRQRQAGTLSYPCCALCGRIHKGKYAPLCQPCWERATPQGKAAVAMRQQRYRNRKRAKVTDCEQDQGQGAPCDCIGYYLGVGGSPGDPTQQDQS